MPPNFAVALRACGVAVALLLATAHAAEKAPSLLGATREQVLARHGEPKSQITVGNREVLFFPRERVVLRNGIVVEVEPLGADSTPRRAPAPGSAPADVPAERPGAPGTAAPAGSTPGGAAEQAAPSAAAPDAKVEIKSVRPPGSPPLRPAPTNEPAAATAPPAATPPPQTPSTTPRSADITTPRPTEPVAPKSTPSSDVVESSRATATPAAPATSRTTVTPAAAAVEPAVAAETPEPAKTDEAVKGEEATAAAAKAKGAKSRGAPAQESDAPDATDAIFTGRNYAIMFLVIGGGVAFLYWRNRQRQLELAATSVSHAPFSTPVTARSGTVFNADLLSKLEWKRFEELVASYYSKTGVVAARTKNGPASPVNIRISWKGESRPFACVKCMAHPVGLIDVKPLQDLVTVLAAEDIRRGYVVTTGKFSVNARDFAEDKHITLLPGDIFLEKLNALPDAARSELMQETTRGDYTTPTCPKCDARMVRSPDDPSVWRCLTHPDQQIAAWK